MNKTKYTDSTLKSWTKDELIHQIRILEHNNAVQKEFNDNQAKLLEKWAPVVHARWIEDGSSEYYENKDEFFYCSAPVCSNCGIPKKNYTELNYCSNCGARMDGGDTHDTR